MSVLKNSWELQNQSRRYPFKSFYGDTFPQLISDLKIVVSGISADDIYINCIKIDNHIVTVSIKNNSTNEVILWGSSREGTTKTLSSNNISARGCITFGKINYNESLEKILSFSEGQLEDGVVTELPSANSRITVDGTSLSGIVTLTGRAGINVTLEEKEISGEFKKVVYIDFSQRANRRVLPDCAVGAEEFWARRGRQGILTINGEKADINGNINISLDTINSDTGSINGEVFETGTMPVDRSVACRRNWDVRIAGDRDLCLEPGCE